METSELLCTPLFKGMEEKDIEVLFSEFNVKETNFKKGDILAFQDEPCNRLIMLLSGSVKGEMSDPSGKVVKVDDIYAPSPLAILFLFGDNNRFPVQATASEDGTAIIIAKQTILKMLGRNEVLLKNYLDISANFAVRISQKLHLMSFRTIRQKLAMYFINLLDKGDTNEIELDISKTALAEYFGVSRQSLERELTNMQNDGLILSNRRKITIVDRNALVKLVSF